MNKPELKEYKNGKIGLIFENKEQMEKLVLGTMLHLHVGKVLGILTGEEEDINFIRKDEIINFLIELNVEIYNLNNIDQISEIIEEKIKELKQEWLRETKT